MSESPAWRCGHPRTPENTAGRIKGQCRECRLARCHAAYEAVSAGERYLHHRIRYLPRQIAETEHKLRALRTEALRLGMTELLPGGQA